MAQKGSGMSDMTLTKSHDVVVVGGGQAGLAIGGLTWLHTPGSALLGWVKDDGEYIAERVGAYRPTASDRALATN
jgi:hypothetical protein